MDKIKIDKNVPLPAHTAGNNKFPWRQMEVGDSVLLPLSSGRGRESAYAAARAIGAKFVTRRTPEGVRVWRVS